MKYKLIMLGTDTELFLQDIATGLPVSAEGLVGGTKENPLPVLGGNGFAVQEDNVMVEFNIPPAATADQFDGHIVNMLSHLKKTFEPKGLRLLAAPSMVFDPQQLQTKQAAHFGCEPDYCAWSLTENEVDKMNPLLKTTRTAGGHVHISFTQDGRAPTVEEIILLVRMLDICLGVPSIFMDQDKRRRPVYGKAGAFRIKKYGEFQGVEYRVLSNFWIKDSQYRKWVFENVQKAMTMLNDWQDVEESLDRVAERVIRAINTGRERDVDWFSSNFGVQVLDYSDSMVI